MRKLAIIPARGGSKRIPRKNIKNFLGKPIIAYSIKNALESGLFDEIMVSTDDEEIAEVAIKYGAKVPFMRSVKSSSDYATTADVIEEVLSEYAKNGEEYTSVCCLYATAPLINCSHLQVAYDLLNDLQADSIIPVVRFSFPIQRALNIEAGKLKMLDLKNLETRSQDLTPTYHDAGQFYWIRTTSFCKYKTILMRNTFPMELSELNVQDIDNADDWSIAEIKYERLKNV